MPRTPRTPPSGSSSVPDLTNAESFDPTSVRKRRTREFDCDKCYDLDITLQKWQTDMMEQISRTITVTVNAVLSTELSKFSEDLKILQTNVTKINTDNALIIQSHSEIKKQLTDFENSVSFTSQRQDDFETRMNNFQEMSTKIINYETELRDIKTKYAELNTEFKKRQQWDRLLNIEIIGVPEKNNENLTEVVTAIAKYVDVKMSSLDIEFATRIQAKQAKPGVPRTIIVKLKNRLVKDNILAGIRRVRGITRRELGMQGNERIFVNEHLTIDNKNLYKKCRELALSKQYKYIWIRNCQIFVRRDDKSPKIYINNLQDLNKIK